MKIKNADLFESVPSLLSSLFERCDYPFEVVAGLRSELEKIIKNPPVGLSVYKPGVLVGRGVTIEEGSTILPPVIIMDGATVRQGAYIRGSVLVGNGAVVGHATEIKNSILMAGAEAPHFNYVGDSIMGNRAHVGAGVILSNLKADKSPIIIKGTSSLSTGMVKLGAILGDGAEIGCSSVLNPGTVIGKGARVYPLVSFRGVLPPDTIAKSESIIVKKQ